MSKQDFTHGRASASGLCVDLHTHSACSDGTLSPRELVDYACAKPLAAIALTDHDTIEGISPALEHAALLAEDGLPVPAVIPGIELSCEYKGLDIHMVGLYIDHRSPAFLERLEHFVSSRTLRNEKICTLLQRHGVQISYKQLQERFPDAVITRAHYGRLMLELGYVSAISEAFEKYIGDGAPCFLPREKISPMDAVSLIRTAKGIPILAHPLLYRMNPSELEELITLLTSVGLRGIEVYYSTHSPSDVCFLSALAGRHGLLPSGGSDFHGSNKPGLDLATGYGDLQVPLSVWEELRRFSQRC